MRLRILTTGEIHANSKKISSYICLFCEGARVGGGTNKKELPLISLCLKHLCVLQLEYSDSETTWKQTREKREKSKSVLPSSPPLPTWFDLILLLLASGYILLRI